MPSEVLLRLEILSGMCAKLRTVAVSNNRVHMLWSLYYCLFMPHICMVLFFTHTPSVVNHTINATAPERLQQRPLFFTMNHTDRTFFVWRLNSARPPHPGHSTILLRSEISSGMCTKLRTVAASNRVHMPWSLYYCLFAPRICVVLFFTHMWFVVNHASNAKPQEMLQQYVSDNNVWVNFKQTQLSICMEIRFMFVPNQVKSLDPCNCVFQVEWNYKENQLDKKITMSNYKWEKRASYC